MKFTYIASSMCGALLLLAGCAHTVPQELADARHAYQQASAGPASELAPADLHDAHRALEHAEAAYEDEPAAQHTRDLAYIAHRKAMKAQAVGQTEMAVRQKTDLERQMTMAQTQALQRTQQELSQTREQLSQSEVQAQLERQRLQSETQALQNQTQQLQTQAQQLQSQTQQLEAERTTIQQQLEQERLARLDAERRAQEALENLKQAMQVREESRGTVITLPGSVLFASAQWTLLTSAQDKLDQVAGALKQMDEKRMILIEGHTDSQGTDSYNQQLSERRADAVKEYLVARGVPPERVRTIGLGESRPVASNASAEGRANNRRVEIIIERDRAAMR